MLFYPHTLLHTSLQLFMKLGTVLHQVLTILQGGSVWLKQWSEANGEAGGNPNVGKYIGIYFGLGIGSSALVVLQTLSLWIFCSIEVRLEQHSVFDEANELIGIVLGVTQTT